MHFGPKTIQNSETSITIDLNIFWPLVFLFSNSEKSRILSPPIDTNDLETHKQTADPYSCFRPQRSLFNEVQNRRHRYKRLGTRARIRHNLANKHTSWKPKSLKNSGKVQWMAWLKSAKIAKRFFDKIEIFMVKNRKNGCFRRKHANHSWKCSKYTYIIFWITSPHFFLFSNTYMVKFKDFR